MESIQATLKRLGSMTISTGTIGAVECEICRDMGYILTRIDGNEYASECTCQEKQRNEQILRNSGISEAFRSRTFNSYIPDNEQRQFIKDKAMKYVQDFSNNSFAILGTVGSGKTHITIAIANYLMEHGIAVRYAQYGNMANELMASKSDDINYHSVANKYKNARVLLIDDLFKGAITEWNGAKRINTRHVDIMFDLINYRYLNNKPIIVSCELLPNDLLDLDEGITSRILEMAKDYIITISDKKMNKRIYKE